MMVYINARPAPRRQPAKPRPRTVLGFCDLEQKIMTVLWDAPPGTWITPLSKIVRAVPGRPATKSVHQALTELCVKGHVIRQVYLNDHDQPCYRYRPAASREEFLAQRIHQLLAFSRDPGKLWETITRMPGAPS